MKICWDSLEKLTYKNGKFGRYEESNNPCTNCKEIFLSKTKSTIFCSVKCSNSSTTTREKIGKTLKGRKLSEETKEKISTAHKGKIISEETRKKISEANILCKIGMKGKKHSVESKDKISKAHRGKIVSEKTKEKLSLSHKGKIISEETKKKLGNGGYSINKFVSYEYYSLILKDFHNIRNDNGILETKCTYCGKWYKPTYIEVNNRLKGINGSGGLNLYCSSNCKRECPTYRQRLYSKGFKHITSREVQPELRKLAFERDNWSCVKCKNTKNLQCHHIDPVVNNPLESADVDNCVTLCKGCHKETHKLPGCTYKELRCK
jgi:hypothetical protein